VKKVLTQSTRFRELAMITSEEFKNEIDKIPASLITTNEKKEALRYFIAKRFKMSENDIGISNYVFFTKESND